MSMSVFFNFIGELSSMGLSSAGARNLQSEGQIALSDMSVLIFCPYQNIILNGSIPACLAQGTEKNQTEKCVNWIHKEERGGQGKERRRIGESVLFLLMSNAFG